MENYIKSIKVNKIFHLQNFEIPISDERFPHLFITGKNGSGKTVLLNAIAKRINEGHGESICNSHFARGNYDNDDVFLKFGDIDIDYACRSRDFVFALYTAFRKVNMIEPKSPELPQLPVIDDINQSKTSVFLNFLSHLKVQAALAANEKNDKDAQNINEWFVNFEKLLKEIYSDDSLELQFNYRNYSFKINTNEKSFRFTELSDGYAAIIDIIADLILRMENSNSETRLFDKKGIVLIDEIETHLHLDLQRNIMPLLTKVFPNIQFIVTTHSPFVLSSLPNAVAFDLEHREIIDNLNEYSYEALAEGYFGVKTSSSYLEMRLNELKNLLQKTDIAPNEKFEIKRLLEDLGGVSEAVSPIIVGQFNELRLKYVDVIKSL